MPLKAVAGDKCTQRFAGGACVPLLSESLAHAKQQAQHFTCVFVADSGSTAVARVVVDGVVCARSRLSLRSFLSSSASTVDLDW